MHRTPNRRRTRIPLLLAVAGAALLSGACDDSPTGDGSDGSEVTVMTRNLYLGADIFRLTEASSAAEVPVIAAEIFATMEANDFEARAGALAAEIEAASPHLVGLQEVELYRIQDPSDYVTGTPGENATTVYIDFLAVLMDSLDARGLDYGVASQVENADVELPAAKSATEFFDVRLTDRDVILARSDVDTRAATSAGYSARVPYEIAPGDTVWFERGYTHVSATVGDADFLFVNTHLEVSAGGALFFVQSAQAAELLTALGAATPVVAVGDFNTEVGEPPYEVLMDSFTDAWTAVSGDGLTCCQPELLTSSEPLTSRIDLILYRGDVEVVSAEVVGDDPADRTTGGLWPSDHAGVVATLRIGG
jgi:endonuclease/exonuclease/phosphatase family metal-dependent hydrolase